MSRPAAALAAPALLAALTVALLAGCGGGGDSAQQAPPVALERADSNCRQLRREAVELGNRAFEEGIDLDRATTERIVKPSIPLLEAFAKRQQQLAEGTGDPEFELYARLFEPVIVLLEERRRSGEESDSPQNIAAQGFEILTGTVADEQRQVAREAGLRACAIDFEQVLTSALRR